MSRRQPLPRRILSFIRTHDLVRAHKPLVVGVSGGPDSVCLLHVLSSIKRPLGVKLHAAHLNHLLRGAESDADADYVARLASGLGIPATIERRDVKAYRREHRLTLEEAARAVRYTFFAEVARSIGGDTVAVGHTADDQAETILMHIIRGTGLTGLRGMQPLSSWYLPDGTELRLARPLLVIDREETESYCAAEGFSPRSDSSNRLPNQLRNKVRSQLIPLLQSYNPDIKEALLRTARAVAADLDYIDEEVSGLWGTVARERPDGISIDRKGFSSLPMSLQRHLIRAALRKILGELQDIESVHIENILKAIAKPAGKRISLPHNLSFHTDYDHGLIAVNGAMASPFPVLEGEYRLNVPGETEFSGWCVRSSIIDQHEAGNESKLRACFDFDVVGDRLTVRGRRRGERFQPLGMESLKKLQDFMVDARIPRYWRDNVPLVCSTGHIIWVVGSRIDHRARVTPSTRRVLRLEFERR